MTLPAAFYMWVRGKELVGEDRRMTAYITMVATATAFGTDSSKSMFPTLVRTLEGIKDDDFILSATEESLRFLYGSRYQGREGEEE